ncbi:MAG: hypothetical protein OXJ52_05835 [Oligoflexia bacterium]|nr:hypothetical protein [Oligoflexia bacterium]
MSFRTKQAFSIVELLVVVGIMLLITGGTIKLLLPYTLQIQNLIHSQMSEGNFRGLISGLDNQACAKTFAGKNIGQSIDQIKDENGVPLFDKTAKDIFQRNLKIVKMKSAPKRSLCSSITASSSGDCPAGCSDPASFPNPCGGASSSSTKGYAELEVYFSRLNSLYEKEDEALACDSSDQSGCYKQSCLLKLAGTPAPSGALGSSVGSCAVSCSGSKESSAESLSNEMNQLLLKEILAERWHKLSCSHTIRQIIPRKGNYPNFYLEVKNHKFYKIRDENNNVFIDLRNASDQEKYGVSSQAYFSIKCGFRNSCSYTGGRIPFTIGLAYMAWTRSLHTLIL